MDFKATGWIERNYKWLVTVIIIAMSIGGVVYYFSLKDKSDTFIAASMYALFLFASGAYMNYMNNIIDDRLQDRIKIYLNLQRVNNFFKAIFEENTFDYESAKRAIISFQVFTGRSENMQEEEIAPYIKQLGIKFDAKELEIENTFLELYSTLSKSITDIVQSYIRDNNISISCRYVNIHNINNFEPDLWCKEYLSDYFTDGTKMVSHLYSKLKDLNDEYSRLELLSLKVSKLYSNYFNRAKLNIKQIQKMYGRKLQYIISQQSDIQDNFSYLFKLLNEMEARISLHIEEHDAKIENYVEELEKISASIDSLYSEVADVREIILEFNDPYFK